ncbi:formate/nitrite transporter family protein [Methylobacterium aerolatum]|uniref:Formate/nitrite transporter FocA (FNT family) n=1 Tax=Methylobacterium aerolatum TaxID=418708 RepID=A0ABU0I483_9HYPH|nr:formate/nitrite transporter family protein [Methylobacterium aerolatum]MDQ0449419.1 formate/nitrite transporter FocA (FNT family) [Methylobacterium aerolatum]GJD37384.1 Inner membrane protein YfdC [Methylobacterium aerolatum]
MPQRDKSDTKARRHEILRTVDEIARPDAYVLHEAIRLGGDEELRRHGGALFLSAFAAGLSIALSMIVPGVLKSLLPEAEWSKIVTTMGYSVGFLVVVLGRQQLFTENTITPVLPLLHDRSAKTGWRVLRLWTIVLFGNILGTLAISVLIAHAGAFSPDVQKAFAEISHDAIAHDFAATFVKAVFAGWMIALMVWFLPATGSAAPLIIMLMTWLVSLCSLAHVVAGSVEAFYLVVTGAASLGDYAGRFFLPTLLGNLFGGVALVAVLNFGQVAPEVEETREVEGERED